MKTMCWYWAMLIFLATWNKVSGFKGVDEALTRLRSTSTSRLCSLKNSIWMADNGKFSFVRKSPEN